MNLDTITDFDFGMGPSNDVRETVRVDKVPDDVTKSEINLVLWLVLENQLSRVDVESFRRLKHRDDGDDDEVDSFINATIGSPSVEAVAGPGTETGLTERQKRKTVSRSAKARRHAEEVLMRAGVSLPFTKLSISERKDMFKQFSSSTELLRNRNFSSISELFDALRKESKLQKEFEVGDRLGRGNYGDVFAVVNRATKTKYAAKRVSLSLDSFEEMKMTLMESSVLRSLQHENIVQCFDAWLEMQYNPNCPEDEVEEQEPLKFYVLMDMCYMSLRQWIQKLPEDKPTFDEVVLIVKHLISGLRFIHSKQILHLDINTQNIMWADAEMTTIKIGDFGLSIKGEAYLHKTGTVPYAAPDGVMTSKSDIYSFGVTMLEVSERILTTQELIERLEGKQFKSRIPFLNNTLHLILTDTPNTRPNAEQLALMFNRVINRRERDPLLLEPEDYRLFGQRPPSSFPDDDDQENRKPSSGHAI